MADTRKALVLHLVGSGQPIQIAVTAETADDLDGRLRRLLETGGTHVVRGADGTGVVVNFAHVATAHLELISSLDKIYGNRTGVSSGFSSGK